MEEKPLQHAILKYRNLNDRKHTQQAVNGATSATSDTTSTVRKRNAFSYQEQTNAVAQLLNANSVAKRSHGMQHNGLYQPTSSLLRPPTSHHHHSHNHGPHSTSKEAFQFEEAYKRGIQHIEKKDYKRALSEFTEAIQISPNKLKAYIQRALCYVNTSRYQPAIDDYCKVITMTPSNADIFAKRAHAYEKLHNYSDAINDYTQAIDLNTTPDKIRDMHLSRGRVYVQMNNLSLALEDFGCAVDLDPRSETALLERGKVYTMFKKYDLALLDFNAMIDLETKSGRPVKQESLLHRAHMHMKLAGEEERTYLADMAASSTEAALVLTTLPSVLEGLSEIDEPKPFQSENALSYVRLAIKDFNHALENEPDSVGLLEERGDCYLHLGDFHNALVDLNAALAHDPKNASLLLLRAMVYKYQDAHLTMNPLHRALNQVTKVIELATHAHQAYFARARLRVENNSVEEAVEDLSAIVEMYGHALLRKDEERDESQVKPPYAIATQPDPKEIAIRALLCRARLYMSLKTEAAVKEAIIDFQRLTLVAPENLDAQLELQVAKEFEEKTRAESVDQAYQWLLEHGDEIAKESSPEMKKAKKKKKKVKKMDPPQFEKPAPAIPPKPPTPNRRLGSVGHPSVVTRDEACESMSEAEGVKEPEAPLPTSNILFHFSLTDTTTSNSTSPDNDGGSLDDEPMESSDNKTTPPSPMSSILMDERYLKKRQKQLEKLRADLIDVCERRDIDSITNAIDRATRKQMQDQLVDEIEKAKQLLEELKKEPKPTEPTQKESISPKTHKDNGDTQKSSPPPTTPEKKPKTPNRSPTSKADTNDDRVVVLQAQLEAMQLQYTHCRLELERLQLQMTPTLNYNLTVHFTHKLQGMERCMRPLNPAILGCPVLRQVDAMIDQSFGPTTESERVRAKILRYLRYVLDQSQCLYACTPSGSFPLKTYLPDSDIDVCLEVPDPALVATWHLAVTQALIGAATLETRYNPQDTPEKASCTVRNVTFINAEVRVVKCTIDNVSIDFTANRFAALGALSLLNEMDVRVGQNHLFKRTLILIKAWAMYDSCRFIPGQRSNILGAVSGALSTFALNTMVMCIFNLYGRRIVHPLQGLMEFLHVYADFDWQYNAVSLFGAVPIASLNSGYKVNTKDLVIDEAFVDQLKAKVATVQMDFRPSLPFQVRACNVVDPLNEMNNVARSVTADKLAEMKQAFQGARQALVEIFYDAWQSAEYNSSSDDVQAEDILSHVEHIDSLFVNGMQMYGSGWRPDLLVHPRQLWHGPMMVGGTSDDDVDVLATEVPAFLR
ncbi:unnamed protein product [Aphanomyces euteiches]